MSGSPPFSKLWQGVEVVSKSFLPAERFCADDEALLQEAAVHKGAICKVGLWTNEGHSAVTPIPLSVGRRAGRLSACESTGRACNPSTLRPCRPCACPP